MAENSDEKLQESLRIQLKQLVSLPDNSVCADCRSPDPTWASISLGGFICINCSGIHRSMGVHISKVRSIQLDNWTQQEVDKMREMGNKKVNATWEYYVPPWVVRPEANGYRYIRDHFIRAKYQHGKYQQGENNPTTFKKEGYITKQGGKVKSWKRRHLVLQDGKLRYSKAPGTKILGEIKVGDGQVEFFEDEFVYNNHTNVFKFVVPKRTYFISCEDALTMVDWMEAIRGARGK